MPDQQPQKLRLFYALWPDAATRAALTQLQLAVRGRKMRPENFHLTLAFLGEQAPASLPLLRQVLQQLGGSALDLQLDQYGYFRRNRIAWAGMQQVPPALIALQQDLAQALVRHRIDYDNQSAFRPHLTLARNAPAPEQLTAVPVLWHADQVALVQSDSLDQGRQYRILASHWLK
ncbi:RNA 2',3'-cyclic phosphodiesterase [Undibacterium arcticum]|uniref:RNA 2',3'-cyclic phosphodiesterase n=1 Tax=Undibacterium arcticum TaxID=1762892 RepID=A0ABV7F052_9BURK